jgi:hypothetical protein
MHDADAEVGRVVTGARTHMRVTRASTVTVAALVACASLAPHVDIVFFCLGSDGHVGVKLVRGARAPGCAEACATPAPCDDECTEAAHPCVRGQDFGCVDILLTAAATIAAGDRTHLCAGGACLLADLDAGCTSARSPVGACRSTTSCVVSPRSFRERRSTVLVI